MAFDILEVRDEKTGWIRAELDRDEKVAWSGEPVPRFFTKSSLPLFLFALPWTGSSIAWVAASLIFTRGAGLFSYAFPLFGVPFVVIGLAMLSSPIGEWLKLSRTAYVVTDKRALIIDHDLRRVRRVRSFSGAELSPITKEQHADGTGDLFFAEVPRRSENDAYPEPVGFTGVRGFREAERALRTLRGET
jgi:hypothetical protein